MSVAKSKVLLCVLLVVINFRSSEMCAAAIAASQSQPGDSQIAAQSNQQFPEGKSQSLYVKGRLERGDHSLPFVLARPNPLKLTNLSTSAISRVFVDQAEYYGETGDTHSPITGSEAELTGYVRDGAYYINVVPLVLGRCGMNIVVFFADGGISSEKLLVNTVAPRDKSVSITVGNGGVQSVDTIIRTYSGKVDKPSNVNRLYIQAKYSDVNQLINIPARFAIFAVRDTNVDSAVSVDKTGYMSINHTGHSLIETTYQESRYLTCIVVTASESSYRGRAQCQDLLKEGEALGTKVRTIDARDAPDGASVHPIKGKQQQCRPFDESQTQLTPKPHPPTLKPMEVQLAPDLQAKLTRMAEQQGRDNAALITEAIERMVNYDVWFTSEVEKGLAAADRGEFIAHETVRAMIDSRYPA